jgi:hypothetical protein
VAAGPLRAGIDARRQGRESTGFFGAAVSLVLASLVVSTVLAASVAAWCAWVWTCARLSGISARYDVLVRAAAYGMSPLAVPLVGPLLAPLALSWSSSALHGALSARASSLRAAGALSMAMAVLVLVFAAAITWSTAGL